MKFKHFFKTAKLADQTAENISNFSYLIFLNISARQTNLHQGLAKLSEDGNGYIFEIRYKQNSDI